MVSEPPAIHPEGHYSATQAMRLLGVSRSWFYDNYINGKKLRQRFKRSTSRPYYLGRDLLAIWRN